MLAEIQILLRQFVSQVSHQIFPAVSPPAIEFEIPLEKSHGDFSCNAAFKFASLLKKNPFEIALTLVSALETHLCDSALKGKIKRIEVKKPGFINFFFEEVVFFEVMAWILKEKESFGRAVHGAGKKIQIEFVSANPTGPLSVAHARQAVVGDALGNIFSFLGYAVTKEYYLNDEGNQINNLGLSLKYRAKELFGRPEEDFPEGGYQGEYIKEMAKLFLAEHQVKSFEELKVLEARNPGSFAHFGVNYLLEVIKTELKDFGVVFDVWSSQMQIATPQNIANVLQFLEEKGFVYTLEGARWLKSTAFGDDKDRVVQKSDGNYTYLAPDIVYHQNKFERGFQQVFNIWGPDHHGYIPRIKAAVAALGYDPKNLEVLIVQLATIFRDGKPLSMSTRMGQFIQLREVINEVGVDAARFFFLMRHLEAHLDFDLELAKKETPENPVYYIQYAYARIHSIFSLAREADLTSKTSGWSLLKEPEELDLIKKAGFFPNILLICEAQRDPYALANYLLELAICFHRFYDRHRVISPDRQLAQERLSLLEVTKIVFASGLKILGVQAPEKM